MKNLLLVEDESVIRLCLTGILQKGDFQVGAYPNAEAVLPLLKPPGASFPFQGAIFDINLGKGMDGIELFTRLRRISSVPVLFHTAYPETILAEQLGSDPSISAYGYLSKSVLGDEFLFRVKSFFSRFSP